MPSASTGGRKKERRRILSVDGERLLLNGEHHQVISGSICYFRILPDQWQDRLEKLVALGANAVEVYVPWNTHEPRPGEWDFSGPADLAGFIRLAGGLGLNVLLRPGPYICAEWVMGGLPWWLLAQDPVPRLRSSDPAFMRPVEAYLRRVALEVAPLLGVNGGPIVAVQVENEYGYWGTDRRYLASLRNLVQETLGPELLLFTVDGCFTHETQCLGGLNGVLRTASFGSQPGARFATLREAQPSGPLVCMEFWVGWFSTWGGGAKIKRSAGSVATALTEMLELGGSVNLFVFAGGTSFGFTAGANLDAATDRLDPHVTSYDYDGILTESGELTDKFHACREVIARHRREQLLPLPSSISQHMSGLAPRSVQFTDSVALLDAVDCLTTNMKYHVRPQALESLGEGLGYALYSFVGTYGDDNGSPGDAVEALDALEGMPLKLNGVHDFAVVLCNRQVLGTWERSVPPRAGLQLPARGTARQLEVLVEVTARVNFGPGIAEHKGLVGRVAAGLRPQDERELLGWESRALPMQWEQLALLPWKEGAALGPGPRFYRGRFELGGDEAPADTWVRVPGFCRGFVALNGFNLGWHRREGPQLTLYAPAALLRPGWNEVVVFELLGPAPAAAASAATAAGQHKVLLEAAPVWSENRAQLALVQAREVWAFCKQVGLRQGSQLARRELHKYINLKVLGAAAVGLLAVLIALVVIVPRVSQ